MAELLLQRVSFAYDPGVPVLRDVDLVLGPGSTALIGENGAGKSTLLRLLNGLLRPAAGRVAVDGTDTAAVSVGTLARTVGLVFQNPSDQLFSARVLDEVAFGPRTLGARREEALGRAEAALAQVGLADQSGRNPHDLGLADRKLVTVASVLAMDTDAVVLDEPTMGQDRAGSARLGAVVADLARRGRTVVTVTHDMAFVAEFCARAVVLHRGRVLTHDDTRDVLGRFGLLTHAGLAPPPITRLGAELGLEPLPLTVDEVVAAARARGWAAAR